MRPPIVVRLDESSGVSIRTSCPRCGQVVPMGVLAPEDVGGATNPPRGPSTPLPSFDVAVMRLVAKGEMDQAIASSLGVPLHRVKRSIREWMIRLDARNRTAAAVKAMAQGLLDAPARSDEGPTHTG